MRALPSVGRLLERWADGGAAPGPRAADALRAVLAEAREQLRDGGPAAPCEDQLLAAARARLAAEDAPHLRRVINAAGVVIHTNLGRAPLPRVAAQAMAEAAAGYANLEFDLERGERGPRAPEVERLARVLTGAEAALPVNNAAAAVLLALSALAGGGGEVIVSRGELVEIGGGFRIPEVIAQGGARLVEVGATNRTRADDYAAAVTERTRVLLKVHPSNYRITGFTAEASLPELAGLARARGLVLMHDLGGGALGDLGALGRSGEPTVGASVAAGADVVAFSGDKLLGGPQAGLLVGRAAVIEPMRRHPLLRALRLDKATLAALEAVLRLHRDPEAAVRHVPVLRMLAQDEAALAARAVRLAGALAGAVGTEVVSTEAFSGGGALPGEALPSRAVAVVRPGLSADALARRLRLGAPPIVGRIAGDRLLLDLFAVADDELDALAAAVRVAAEAPPP
ncbi:MAG: L-seryl-tRNA(Sec) selenium transferase [Caulobacteraceae bacterium]|nr:L-seryl-tRNA(Sec) selenium transferase [Caulobacter sp.]